MFGMQDHSRGVPVQEVLSPALNQRAIPVNAYVPYPRWGVPETEINRRAYLKWEAAGKPKGHDFRFWLEAKEELLQGNETTPSGEIVEGDEALAFQSESLVSAPLLR